MTNQKNLKIKVLPVDDHPVVLEGVRSCLRASGPFDVVGLAASGEEAVRLSKILSPDVILMDVTMPLMDGLEATRRLRQACPRVKVLMFTDREDNEAVGEMIQCGARGCIRKSASGPELAAAIKRVHHGETCFAPDAAQMFFDDYVRRGGKPHESAVRRISDRERQVLRLIVEGAANKDAAVTLHISVRTVEKHRQRIMKKLGVHKATELVRYALTTGIVNLVCTDPNAPNPPARFYRARDARP